MLEKTDFSSTASIIISNYNYADFLAEAIESALAVDWPDVEVIVVDDGSTDGSRDIIRSYGTRVIPVFQENSGQLAAYEAVADRILYDARPPKGADRPGGHGRPFDWNLLSAVSHKKPVMLSGGLNPENVADAIRIVRPDAVDVSSGVEDTPGVKNAAKIKAFVQNARAAAEKYLREKVS